ncbi:MAG: hypothetical protein C4547_00075 [Phycisphaerales bacterium]|nr:MAG: hypothetical protein C4547_00075 [Phycisphaerales bacterium]
MNCTPPTVRRRLCAVAVLVVVFLPVGDAPAQEYVVEEIGSLGGGGTAPNGVNSGGVVVGVSDTAGGDSRAFRWIGGRAEDLGAGDFSIAYGISDGGVIVGDTGDFTPFRWENGVITSLPLLPNHTEGSALGINAAGVVVGVSAGGFEAAPVRWSGGAVAELPALEGFTITAPLAINTSGMICGVALDLFGGASRGVVWTNGNIADVGLPPQFSDLIARDVNDSGVVACIAESEGQTAAFTWRDGRFTRLPDLAGAAGYEAELAINNDGWVVGQAVLQNGDFRAVLWRDGVAINLNDLIAPGSGWVLWAAYDVSNTGLIAGIGELDGSDAAFLLQPAPEPDADTDRDGVPDVLDNCPNEPNPGQEDADDDGVGDVCDNCVDDKNADQADADGDGYGDACDNCPKDANADQSDADDDGRGDVCDPCPEGDDGKDSDGDTVTDCEDLCPGKDDLPDADGDQTPDCLDGCPRNPDKIEPDLCGCDPGDCELPDGGEGCEFDGDFDGVPDCVDGCPADRNKFEPGACGCGKSDADTDLDDVPDCFDNCPDLPNVDQADADEDNVGDDCDNCPDKSNYDQADSDLDGFGDGCDTCPHDPDKIDPGRCGCGRAETDTDGDGTPDCRDSCPDDPNKVAIGACGCGFADDDADEDGVADCRDNCSQVANPDQADDDTDGIGNACQDEITGNPNPDDSSTGNGMGIDICGGGMASMIPLIVVMLVAAPRRRAWRA